MQTIVPIATKLKNDKTCDAELMRSTF